MPYYAYMTHTSRIFRILGLFAVGFAFLVPAASHAAGLLRTVPVGSNPEQLTLVGTKLYVSNFLDNTVSVVDTVQATTTSTIAVGGEPSAQLLLGGKLYVTDQSSNAVSVIDTTTDSVSATVGTGLQPIALAAIGSKVYTANHDGNSVTTIDTANGNATTTIPVGGHPSALSVIGTKLYVSNTSSDTVTVIDTANANATSTVALGSGVSPSTSVAIGTKLYVVDGAAAKVSIIDTANGNATSSIAVGAAPSSLAVIGTKLYVGNITDGSISVIDTTNGTVTTPITSIAQPNSLVAVGSKLYVGSQTAVVLYIYDTANGNALSEVFPDGVLNHLVSDGSMRLYGSSAQGTVNIFDINGTAPVLTEVTPIPSTISSDHAQYDYSASYPSGEEEEVLVGGCSNATVNATPISNSSTNSILISGLTSNVAVTCTVSLQDAAANNSNTLTIGPFTYVPPAAHHSGGSVQDQVKNLVALGNTAAAQALQAQWPNLYASTTSSTSVLVSTTGSSASMPARDLTIGSVGSDVQALQKLLNALGFTVAASGPGSAGNETTMFGALTRAALAKYQGANGISPAAGYFGPLTRAHLKAAGATGIWW